MAATEKTPIVVAVPITEEETPTCDYCCCTCYPRCKDKCAVFLAILLIISVVMFLAASAMYMASEEISPKVLCPDGIISTVKFMGYLFSLLVSLIFIVATYSKACDRCWNVCTCCSASEVLIFACFFVVFLPLLICSMWLNFSGMNMIVQSSTDGAIYRCEGDQENPDAHRILFESNGGATNHLNQKCNFWSLDTLCDSGSCAFRVHPSLVDVNGVKGAYRCSDSSPEGQDVCVSYLRFTHTYSHIQTTLAYVSVTLIMIFSIWIVRRNQSDDCARCCDCCGPKGPRYKLIPQQVPSILKDSFFGI